MATEFALGIAALLIPVACLVLTMPTWSAAGGGQVIASTGVCDARRGCGAPRPA